MESNTRIKLKELRTKINNFSKLTNLGEYDFEAQVIELSRVDKKQLGELLGVLKNIGDEITFCEYKIIMGVLPVCSHECAHFYDSTATLWGISLMRIMYGGFSSNPKLNEDHMQYYKAKKAFNAIRKIGIQDYYAWESSEISKSPKWIQSITVGIIFDGNGFPTDHPVLFMNFHNNSHERFARAPISLLSMLETTAKHQEIMTKLKYVNMLNENDHLIESKLVLGELSREIYETSYLPYYTCAHFVSNKISEENLLYVLIFASTVVRICLNFPKKCFKKLAESDLILSEMGDPSIFKVGLHNYDRPILFYLLVTKVSNLLKGQGECELSKKIELILLALKSLGIDYQEMVSLSCLEFCDTIKSIDGFKVPFNEKLSRACVSNFCKGKYIGNSILPFDELELPPVYLSDGDAENPLNKGSIYRDCSLDEIVEPLIEHISWLSRFNEACI